MATARAVKSPTSERIVTTVTKEVIPTGSERTTPEFWSYIEKLTDADWERHLIYLYRVDPRMTTMADGTGLPTEGTSLEKIYNGQIEMRPGHMVALRSKEDFEIAIREKWGGKVFRLIIKDGNQRVTQARIANEYPPKFPNVVTANAGAGATGPSMTPMSDSANTADVAKAAINTIAGQERQSTEIAIGALKAAADVVQKFGAGGSGSMNDRIMDLLITRALAPQPDAIDTMVKLLAVMRAPGVSPDGAGNGTMSPALNKVIDVAIERLLTNAPAGPVASASGELIRQLPAVAGYVVQAFQEWRAGMEVQRDTAFAMAGRQPPGTQTVQAPPRSLPPQSNPAPAPEGQQMLTVEFLEQKIMAILARGASADDSADDVLAFLELMAPELITQLRSQGEEGLLRLFASRPILKPATGNMPRLSEFIKAFLRIAGAPEPPNGAPPNAS